MCLDFVLHALANMENCFENIWFVVTCMKWCNNGFLVTEEEKRERDWVTDSETETDTIFFKKSSSWCIKPRLQKSHLQVICMVYVYVVSPNKQKVWLTHGFVCLHLFHKFASFTMKHVCITKFGRTSTSRHRETQRDNGAEVQTYK